jgi:redox-sensitive bicupin YhaK (pirin superfamily)
VAATVELSIPSRARSIGEHTVGRVLPAPKRRSVGPFVFLDHMGPMAIPPGAGFDVKPHPHIGLATVTYLFEGEIVHRDSLGSEQAIRPGAINWMIAGRGIVHSERASDEARRAGSRVHGLQFWTALPAALEESAPSFAHHAAATLPDVGAPGARLRVLAGAAHGVASPVVASSRLFLVEAQMDGGASIDLPNDYPERAIYVVEGAIAVGDATIPSGSMAVMAPGEARIAAARDARVVVLGGDPLDGPRFMEWNFVSGARERIDRAKSDWKERRFPLVPGDAVEFVPLPE